MVIKLNNKDKKFYTYMGKIFGSRLIQRQTNDRIYDDDNKQWYMYIEKGNILACVSVSKQSIKNVYTTKDEYLKDIFDVIKDEMQIEPSIVTNIYSDLYIKNGFNVEDCKSFKNFVVISHKKVGENEK